MRAPVLYQLLLGVWVVGWMPVLLGCASEPKTVMFWLCNTTTKQTTRSSCCMLRGSVASQLDMLFKLDGGLLEAI